MEYLMLGLFIGTIIGLIIGHYWGYRANKTEVIVFKVKDL